MNRTEALEEGAPGFPRRVSEVRRKDLLVGTGCSQFTEGEIQTAVNSSHQQLVLEGSITHMHPVHKYRNEEPESQWCPLDLVANWWKGFLSIGLPGVLHCKPSNVRYN